VHEAKERLAFAKRAREELLLKRRPPTGRFEGLPVLRERERERERERV
jgi:hypothetical protein